MKQRFRADYYDYVQAEFSNHLPEIDVAADDIEQYVMTHKGLDNEELIIGVEELNTYEGNENDFYKVFLLTMFEFGNYQNDKDDKIIVEPLTNSSILNNYVEKKFIYTYSDEA